MELQSFHPPPKPKQFNPPLSSKPQTSILTTLLLPFLLLLTTIQPVEGTCTEKIKFEELDSPSLSNQQWDA